MNINQKNAKNQIITTISNIIINACNSNINQIENPEKLNQQREQEAGDEGMNKIETFYLKGT